MSHKVHTLFQRLNPAQDGLNFDYMGAAEYEFGAAHIALDLLVNDLGAPHEVVETGIVLTREDSPFRFQGPIDKKSYSWRRLSKHQKEREIEQRERVETLLDGHPLLLRHVPAITDAEGLADLLSVSRFEDLLNKGVMWRPDTQAWLGLSPVVGILYHPTREGEVNAFLERILGVRREKNPDDLARAEAALTRALSGQGRGVDNDGARTVLDAIRSQGEPRP